MFRSFISIGLIVSLFLCACAPSANVVQTAIAQTQAAVPTATETPLPTNTTTPSPVPSNTPTATELPSSGTRPPLHKLLIANSDFGPLSDLIDINPVMDNKIASDLPDSCRAIFNLKYPLNGKISMALYKYDSSSKAEEINQGLKAAGTNKAVFKMTASTNFPDNFWVGSDITGVIWAGATKNEIVMQVSVELVSTTDTQEAALALMLLKNQVIRLEDGGY